MTAPSGFSERIFEFGFNAEYADRHKAVLAGMPHIPTQNQEKLLGYDVQFAIDARGGAKHYLALQHKVARYVDGKSSSNQKFRQRVGAPYYAFRIDVDQFNLIESVASARSPGLAFYYCAPLFHTTEAMSDRYTSRDIESNSVWIDVQDVGQLATNESHTMVYSPKGDVAFVFSETPRELRISLASVKSQSLHIESGTSIGSPAELAEILRTEVDHYFASGRSFASRRTHLSGHQNWPSTETQLEVSSKVPAKIGVLSSPMCQLIDVVTKDMGASLLVETSALK